MTLAYWCIFFAIFLPIFCAAYAKYRAGFSPADNHNPRAFLARAQGKAARADAAQQNSYEIFPPFAAAVIIAHATGNAAQGTINCLAVLFVLLRLAFIYCYLNDRPSLRSAAWSGAMLCTVLLFVAAV